MSASSDEIQKFFEEMRYDLQLETKDDFDAWINENNLDLATVQNICEIGVLRNKIRDSIPDEDIAEYFNNNKEGMDVAELYSITVESEDLASELMAQIEEGEDSFLNLALEHSTDQDIYRQGGFNGEVTRETVRADVEAAVFSASAGDLIGPIKDEDGYSIYMVRNAVSPESEDVKDSIRDQVFENLIEEISARVDVEQAILGIKDDPVDESAADEEDEED